MLELRKSKLEEISAFIEMENSEDTKQYVIPYAVEKHISEMRSEKVIYLSIYHVDKLSGFMILAIEGIGSVEFRRIVISTKGNGLGQQAINSMESFCAQQLGCSRVWLDVFESNKRGLHIYKKLGYKQFKVGENNGSTLLFMEKVL